MEHKKFQHEKSLRSTTKNGWYTEYDSVDRVTYYKMSSGYWAKFWYNDPAPNGHYDVMAIKIVHKYSPEYKTENK